MTGNNRGDFSRPVSREATGRADGGTAALPADRNVDATVGDGAKRDAIQVVRADIAEDHIDRIDRHRVDDGRVLQQLAVESRIDIRTRWRLHKFVEIMQL